MTPKEIVQRTLEFTGPERIAHSFNPFDMAGASPVLPNERSAWVKINDREWQRMDDWGNTWGRVDDTSMGEVIKGGLEDLTQVDSYPLPDFSKSDVYAPAKANLDKYPDHYHLASICGFEFSMARKLRKMEQYLEDLILERESISLLHDRIGQLIDEQIHGMKSIGADAIMIWEDWGTQQQTLINPKLWREEFKPRFKQHCDLVHSLGMKMFMHSCGKITAIIPDLIESGIDCFQFDQPTVHGLDTLAGFQKTHKITYWSPVDIQKTLQTRDEYIIRAEAKEMVDKLWQGRGGLIAGHYVDEKSIGLEPRWQQIAAEVFLSQGIRSNYVA